MLSIISRIDHLWEKIILIKALSKFGENKLFNNHQQCVTSNADYSVSEENKSTGKEFQRDAKHGIKLFVLHFSLCFKSYRNKQIKSHLDWILRCTEIQTYLDWIFHIAQHAYRWSHSMTWVGIEPGLLNPRCSTHVARCLRCQYSLEIAALWRDKNSKFKAQYYFGLNLQGQLLQFCLLLFWYWNQGSLTGELNVCRLQVWGKPVNNKPETAVGNCQPTKRTYGINAKKRWKASHFDPFKSFSRLI